MELIHHSLSERSLGKDGRITRSGSTYTYHYFLRDHLGNNRVGFAQGTNVTAPNFTADYYPFGMQYRQYIRTGSPKNNYLYNGKELQDGIRQYDYGARLYDPVIGRWGAMDPLAEHPSQIGLSPYSSMRNNPMLFIDPDGRFADYFDEDGNYLGNDGVDDDKIRIVPVRNGWFSSNYNTLPFNFFNKDRSVNVDVGMAMSRDISDLSSAERSNVAEGVLGFYFEQTGYSLSDLQSGKIDNTGVWSYALASAKMGGRTIGSDHLLPDAISIEVNYGALGRTLRNAADVKNLFVHEYSGHIGDLQNNPAMKVGTNRAWLENSATILQLQHPTWNRVSPEFRSHIERNQSRFLTNQQRRTYFP